MSGHRRTPSNSLADEVVTLMDELLEEEKSHKPKKISANGKSQSEMNVNTSLSDETNAQRTTRSASIGSSTPATAPQPQTAPQKQSNVAAVPTKTTNVNQPPAKQAPRPTTPLGTKSTSSVISPPVKKPANDTPTKSSQNWTNALSSYGISFSSPKKNGNGTVTVEQLQKRILALEEEIKMADSFKLSLKETLGLQVESLRLDLDLEKEKVKRLEYELSLKGSEPTSQNNTPKLDKGTGEKSEILGKLVKVWEEEKKLAQQIKTSQDANGKLIKQHEDNIQKLASAIKEESIFLISLREQKQQLEKQPHYQYRGSKEEQQLGGKLGVSEANMKRLNEEMEKERKIIRDLENAGMTSVVDRKLESYISLHDESIKALRELTDLNVGAAANLQKQLEDVTKQRDADKEYYENKAKLFEKQIAELQTAKDNLDKEKQLIQTRLSEEKESLATVASQKEAEAARIKAEYENKVKQLEDEVAVLKDAQTQVGPLHDKIRALGNQIGEEQNKTMEAEQKVAEMEKKVQSLTNDLSSKQNELTSAQQTYEAAKQELQQKIQAIAQERDGLQSKSQELLTQRERLEKELSDRITDMQKDKDQLEDNLKERTSKLEEEMAHEKETEIKLAEVRDQLAVSEGQRRALEELYQKLQSEMKEFDALHKTKVEELTNQMGDLTSKLQLEIAEKEKLTTKITNMTNAYEVFTTAFTKA